MELRRRFDFRKIVSVIYVMAFAIYLIVGLSPAGATTYEISGELIIPSIHLSSDVTTLALENHELATPDTIVGSYSKYPSKIFLIGHSTTVFQNLNQITSGDMFFYNDKPYVVVGTKTLQKSEVDMKKILAPEPQNTLIIMTCAGEVTNGDATHRFIVTAQEA